MATLVTILSLCGVELATGGTLGVIVGVLGVPGVKQLLSSVGMKFLRDANKPLKPDQKVMLFKNLHDGYGVWDCTERRWANPAAITAEMIAKEPKRWVVSTPCLPGLR